MLASISTGWFGARVTRKRNIGLWKYSSCRSNVDNEVVLSGADSGRCHTGRQFRRDGLFDLHVSGPEFSRGDRFERGKSSLLSFPPPHFSFLFRSFSAIIRRLRNRGFLRFACWIDASNRENNWVPSSALTSDFRCRLKPRISAFQRGEFFFLLLPSLRCWSVTEWHSVIEKAMKNLPVGRSRLSFISFRRARAVLPRMF